MVWPSGSALATCRPAMAPAAPGRFSTTTLWPSDWESLSANRRAITSTPPPGGKPTTSRSGRDGYGLVCALAAQGTASISAARSAGR